MTVARDVAALIDQLPGDRVLVAIDGPDAAGKTSFARAVAGWLARPSLCASVDAWHNPRSIRARRGVESPEGYYRDSFDLASLARDLLNPFRDGASTVHTAKFDYRTDSSDRKLQDVPGSSVLLFDGVFLLRPELRELWDLSIYLHVPESVSLERALVRDVEQFGDTAAVQRRYRRRYLPGQALYRASAAPLENSTIAVDNSDWRAPRVLRWPSDR